MKILITGATGQIGSRVMAHCLAHPDITSVVALSRRSLPQTSEKLTTVLVDDFLNIPTEVLEEHKDAECMFWCLGSITGNIESDLDMPLAFTHAMGRVVAADKTRAKPFRFIFLSGVFVEHDESRDLWFLRYARKIKGRTVVLTQRYAKEHPDYWETQAVRCGIVVLPGSWPGAILQLLLGEKWTVGVEDFGAYMAWLAVEGRDEGQDIPGVRSVRQGAIELKRRGPVA